MNAKKKGNAGEFKKGNVPHNKGAGGLIVSCFECSSLIKKSPHYIERSKRSFCSRACYYESKKGNPVNELGKKLPLATRLKMSIARVGQNNPNWQGGLSLLSRGERYIAMSRAKYKEWRKNVFERDNYTCQNCGTRCGEGRDVVLNADHIKQWAYYPKLRYEISNGITLCLPCHRKTATWGRNKKLSYA